MLCKVIFVVFVSAWFTTVAEGLKRSDSPVHERMAAISSPTVLLISDSICKYVAGVDGMEVMPFPGFTAVRLTVLNASWNVQKILDFVKKSILSEVSVAGNGKDMHGHWDADDKDRCILRCNDGYEPSGCRVLRKENGDWNYDEPECQKASLISGKTVAAVGVGVAAVVGAPLVLAGAGFTAAGVAAGTFAAWLQTPFTAAGSWFALSQSAGVIGTAATTKAGIGGVFSGITYWMSDNCEKE